jgi:hypothetical protein
VGQQVPDFTLSDTSGRPVSLSTLLASPVAVRARLEDYEREDRSFDGLTLDGVCERNPELNVEVVASGLHILESSPAESIKTDIPQSRRPPDPPVECGLRGKLQPGRWF